MRTKLRAVREYLLSHSERIGGRARSECGPLESESMCADNERKACNTVIYLGVDVGSTTTKVVALDARSRDVLHSVYRRHHAHQIESLRPLLADVAKRFPNASFRMALSGSGSKSIASSLGVPYVQEVVANSIAVQELHPNARCAIELGGQDAKMIFFECDEETGALAVSDMRMNGSCAGGTGAFIDEIAALLKAPVEDLNGLAARGVRVYSVSGRCGVYAKTDIQPLLNQGASKEDIALSTFHAIAKQTLGGLAQGLDIHPPVVFEGGPLTFNPVLVDVFAERLALDPADVVVPESPETIVARGAALSLFGLFADAEAAVDLSGLSTLLDRAREAVSSAGSHGTPFFPDDATLAAFRERHALPASFEGMDGCATVLPVYLGIDSGSTTTKFVLLDEDERPIDGFYAANEGEPLDIACRALLSLHERYRARGIELEVLGAGTTGYGELLFSRAFRTDCHMVETLAHSLAAAQYVPDATFILDIGGQDMKAIWVDGGVVTDIVVNEACSSGCGSFLESFAHSLGVPAEGIAEAAFRSRNPAQLGSRCTVFMNSSVVTEQKNGKSPDDIMAGLCRSIIENVFTKVIRVSNIDALGERIVVQGGTFKNDAVLAAFEDYLGKQVVRAPYPGHMGAIGAALVAKREHEERRARGDTSPSTFIGFEALRTFSFEQRANVTCPFCANACNRTLVTFGDGSTWVTGNRCARGEVIGDPRDEAVRAALRAKAHAGSSVENVFDVRERLLFAEYDYDQVLPENGTVIGLPRVLSLWDNAPFWTTFLRALGFTVRLSRPSTRALYEEGLPAVASDTVCFPAKLVHGHVRDLAAAGVDRIFMPVVTTVPSENTQATSESMCAVVKGYPLVIRNSDNPEERFGVPFDAPLFHWYSAADRERQLSGYLEEAFGIDRDSCARALACADRAQKRFREQLVRAGEHALESVRGTGSFAVVLASRPYHNDPLVNHDLPRLFCDLGIPVIPPDALPGVNDVDLSLSRLDIVNNYHARALSSALLAAQGPSLEYVQLVSFGCGHDAYLSDEIARLMREVGDKAPLVLKVDESDVPGPLRIRVRSFVETVSLRRRVRAQAASAALDAVSPRTDAVALSDPYPVKFTKIDRAERVLLVPNTSHAFSRLMAAVFSKQGVRAVPLEVGREEAIRLGKAYVHNDICFPAQIVIGEALAALESGEYDHCEVAVATGKYIGDCRLTHYAALLRKALDDAGYADVPIVTNDDVDYHNMHPGFKMNALSAARIAFALPMIDVLEELLRKLRPYELVEGEAERAFDEGLDAVVEGLERAGARGAKAGFKRAIARMNEVAYDRSHRRPRVLIVGEYLLNFHPGANHDVERYLEDNGFEIIEARMTDIIRKTYFYKNAQIKEYGIDKPFSEATWYAVANGLFEYAQDVTDRIASAHPLYERVTRMPELVRASDPIIHHTFDAGEGVLIPAEILHHAAHGCEAFLILQPFGCLPNHIVGRGIAKKLKELYPNVQILPLDYDPDVSFANLENRLQMLVMNARGKAASSAASASDAPRAALAAVSADLAACAGAIAELAWDLGALAKEVSHQVEGPSEPSMDALAVLAEAMAEKVGELSERAREVARRAEAAAAHAREVAGERMDGASERVQGVAVRMSELAALVSDEASRCAEEAYGRVLSMKNGRASSIETGGFSLELLAEDARGQASRVAARANSLGVQAGDVVREASELVTDERNYDCGA